MTSRPPPLRLRRHLQGRRGEEEHHSNDGDHNHNKSMSGNDRPHWLSTKSKRKKNRTSTSSFMFGVLVAAATIIISSLLLLRPLFNSDAADVKVKPPQSPKLNRKETPASCQHLPSIYWINLDKSKERRYSLEKSMKLSGVVAQHRVAAIDAKQVIALMDTKQVMFHPQIKFDAGNGDPSFWRHPDNIYSFNYAASLLSHLKAIKQAYDDGHEAALIFEDDALLSTFFCDKYDEYVARAPEGWKVLQFATNNVRVIMHGSLIYEPFISWQRYHDSARAYLINRSGMETLLGKVHHTNLRGESIWSILEFPSVVADETIYAFTGAENTYYSTGLWIDTSDLDSTILNKSQQSKCPYAPLEGQKSEQVAMKSETPPPHLFGRSLLVVMNVCISNESQVEREIEVINQDIHAVCKFHRVCEWEINVVAVDESLTTLFEEAASELPPYVHLHTNTKVHSGAFNKFLFVGNILRKLANFDLMLLKDNDQRIIGFPWRTFVEHTENTVISSPLRSNQRDHMLFNMEKEESQDIQFHDANNWVLPYNRKHWNPRLLNKFERIEPVEVPFLETYFVLMDAMFAKHFFERAFASGSLNDSSIEYLWCSAAFDWDSKRTSCSLIPLVSTHEESLNVAKADAFIANESTDTSIQSSGKSSDPNKDKLMSLVMEWKDIFGMQHTVSEMEQLCAKRMDIDIEFVEGDKKGIHTIIDDCARSFIDQSLPSVGTQ